MTAGREAIGGRTGGDDARIDAAGVGGASAPPRTDPGEDGIVMRGAPFGGGAGMAGITAVTGAAGADSDGTAGGTADGIAGAGGGIEGAFDDRAAAGSGGGGLVDRALAGGGGFVERALAGGGFVDRALAGFGPIVSSLTAAPELGAAGGTETGRGAEPSTSRICSARSASVFAASRSVHAPTTDAVARCTDSSSASAMPRAVAKRSFGSRARPRRTTSSTVPATSALNALGGSIFFDMI